MTLASTLLLGTIFVLLLGMLAGMLRAWAWAFVRIRQGLPLLPPARPRTVPWGFGSIALVLLVYFLVNLGVSLAYAAITGARPTPTLPDLDATTAPANPQSRFSFSELMLMLSLTNGVVILVVPPLLRLTSGARPADLGLERRGFVRNVIVGAVGFLLVAPVVYAFNLLAVLIWQPNKHPVELMVHSEPSAGIAQLAVLSAVILAPAAEELIFRAVVQGWLLKFLERPPRSELPAVEAPVEAVNLLPPDALLAPRDEPTDAGPDAEDNPYRAPQTQEFADPRPSACYRVERAPLLAIMMTSILFAAVHLPQWPAPLAIFLLSMGLGLVYHRSGSLVAAIVMHALFNSLGTLVLLASMLKGDPAVKKATPAPGCVDFPARCAALPLR